MALAPAQDTYTGRRAPVAAAWRAASAACFGLLGLAACQSYAYAQQGDTAVLIGGRGEYYLAALPPGWGKRAEAGDALGHHGDWLPEGQSLADWRDRITLQVVPELAGEAPPAFLDRMANLRAETCARMFATEVERARLNGFAVGLRVIACTRDNRTGTGEVTVMRALAGAQALYVIQRVFRVVPFSVQAFPLSGEALDRARAAIEFGFACERGSAARPCPAEWRAVLDSLDPSRALTVFPAAP
jgi:hypothetical protein